MLEKAFDSDDPGSGSGENEIHLCCCLSCPLHVEGGSAVGTKCILITAQQWPDNKDSTMSKIHHWYDLKIFSEKLEKSTTIFLHGLGRDLNTKFDHDYDQIDKCNFAELQNDQQRWQFITTHRTWSRNRIRIKFSSKEKWACYSIDHNPCVVFHRLVSASSIPDIRQLLL